MKVVLDERGFGMKEVLDEKFWDEKRQVHPNLDETVPTRLKRRNPKLCTFGVLGLSCEVSQDSVTAATSRRRRQLRALPWSGSDIESDTDPSEVVVSSYVPPEALDAMERDLTMDPESVTQAPSGLLPIWVDEASKVTFAMPGGCGALSWIAKVLRRRQSRCTGLGRVRIMRAEWLCYRGEQFLHQEVAVDLSQASTEKKIQVSRIVSAMHSI